MQRRQRASAAIMNPGSPPQEKLDGIDLVEDSKISSFPQKPTPLAL